MPPPQISYAQPQDDPPSNLKEEGVGYGSFWHTTGNGKTLTSFKASTLLKLNEQIHKCLFVVDRKDLDRQTREDWSSSDKTLPAGKARRVSARSANQFNRFQEGCAEENTNTAARKHSTLIDCVPLNFTP